MKLQPRASKRDRQTPPIDIYRSAANLLFNYILSQSESLQEISKLLRLFRLMMTSAGLSYSVSFANFRLFACNKKNPKELDLISSAFDESLLRRIKALPRHSHSLSWFSAAVHLLSFAHSEARALISCLKVDGDGSVVGWYLDDSLKLLDICNSITSDIERYRHRRLTVNCAIHLLQDPTPEKMLRARDLLSDWRSPGSAKGNDDVESLIRGLAANLRKKLTGKISAVGKLVCHIVRAVSVLTVFVATSLISALRESPEITKLRARAPTEFSWGSLINELESIAMDQKKPLLVEVDEVEACAKDALTAMDNAALKEAAENLELRLEPLVVGLDALTGAVNEMFRTVMEIRTSIVDTLRADAHGQQPTKKKTKANRVVPAVCSS